MVTSQEGDRVKTTGKSTYVVIPSVLHILANRTDQNRLELGQLLPQSQAASVFNRTPFRFVAFASRSSPCSVFAKFFAAVSP